MKLFKYSLIIIFIFFFTSANSYEKNSELKNKISKNIRCLICQGQSVYDSQSDFAISIKSLIEQKLEEGLSEDSIYEFLKTQYGQWIVYDPEFNKNTFILWLLPILLFLAGGAIIIRKLKIQKL
jgi:cytochrome c-type biogenesis protein CcmH